MIIKIEKCKFGKEYNNEQTSFWQNNNGQWRFDVACRHYQTCAERKNCRGMTEGAETPEEAIEAWNGLIKK